MIDPLDELVRLASNVSLHSNGCGTRLVVETAGKEGIGLLSEVPKGTMVQLLIS